MNPFARAIAAAQRTVRQVAGVKIVYRRSSTELRLTAVIGQTIHTLDDLNGSQLVIESRDYLIDAAGFVLDGQPLEPARGDQIIEGNLQYSVLDQTSMPCWRWSDIHRLQLRIHTKLFGKV